MRWRTNSKLLLEGSSSCAWWGQRTTGMVRSEDDTYTGRARTNNPGGGGLLVRNLTSTQVSIIRNSLFRDWENPVFLLWEVCRLYSTRNWYSPGYFSLLGMEDVADMARLRDCWVSLDPNWSNKETKKLSPSISSGRDEGPGLLRSKTPSKSFWDLPATCCLWETSREPPVVSSLIFTLRNSV